MGSLLTLKLHPFLDWWGEEDSFSDMALLLNAMKSRAINEN